MAQYYNTFGKSTMRQKYYNSRKFVVLGSEVRSQLPVSLKLSKRYLYNKSASCCKLQCANNQSWVYTTTPIWHTIWHTIIPSIFAPDFFCTFHKNTWYVLPIAHRLCFLSGLARMYSCWSCVFHAWKRCFSFCWSILSVFFTFLPIGLYSRKSTEHSKVQVNHL